MEKLHELSSILKSHACANVTENVIGHFSVTIDCVRLLIRGFPLYTYSMTMTQNSLSTWKIFLIRAIFYIREISKDYPEIHL